MEVVPNKRASVNVKEERRMECVSVDEDHKIGSDKQTRGGDSSLKSSSSPNRKDSSISNQVNIASERQSPSNPKGSVTINQKDDQLESTKAEMGEVREENERLKTLLARIVKDYQSLQMHFYDIVQQEQSKQPSETTPAPPPPPRGSNLEEEDEEGPELISLTLGTTSTTKKELEKVNMASSSSSKISKENIEEGLTLGLDCKFEGSSNGVNGGPPSTSTNSMEEGNKEVEEAGEPWPPSKILKNMRNSGGDGDEVLQQQQEHVKKTRVSVRAKCDAPTMHDGCQWRKYGQKIAKGNPCPRAYYRCTVAPACPVRKQVQRCAEDMSILITTYEGTHNHPLPISATAMASTTSAAASMLISGSSFSSSSLRPPTTIPSSSSFNPNLHALNFNLSDPTTASANGAPPRPCPFYLPNPTTSSTHSYPTITLDLTSPPQFNRYSFSTNPRYSTSFIFSDSTTSTLPLTSSSWNNDYLSNYGAHQSYNKSPMGPLGSLGLTNKQQQDNFLHQSYLQKFVNPTMSSGAGGQQQVLTDSIAKAITSDPSFQSALAAAITSYVGGPGGGAQGGGGGDQGGAGNGCGSSFLTRNGSGSGSGPALGPGPNAQVFLSSKSASPVKNRENLN